jgi:hypothetical protein
MKKFITPPYRFEPGPPGVGLVEIDVEDFDIKRLVSIINTTKGEIIYIPTSSNKNYTSISNGNCIYLAYNTSSNSSDDVLQIIYETTDESDFLETMTFLLNSIFNKLPRTDTLQRSAVNVETGTVAVSSLPTLASVTTVTTVSTVSTVGTINNFAGGNAALIPYNLSTSAAAYLYEKITIT